MRGTLKRHRPWAAKALITAAGVGAFPIICRADITRSVSGSNWTISNGALTVVFASTKSNLTSIKVAGHSDNILDPGNSQLYDELAKSGLDAGTPGALTSNFDLDPQGRYIDFWTNTASSATEGFTYQIHYLMFNNDPAIHMYEVVKHAPTDIAASYVQGQFLMRVDPAKFSTLYQVNTSLNNPGAQITHLPSTTAELSELNGTKGYGGTITLADGTTKVNPRLDIPEVLDLAGDDGHDGQPDLISLIGRPFLNKYDYSSYEQLHQGHTEYGSIYAISDVVTSHETFSGGPTKQNLQFTNNILMTEFLSGHYGTGGYSYVPVQGQDSTKLYGPYTFRVTTTNGETGTQLYNDAIDSASSYPTLYDQDATLIGNAYVPSTSRGSLQVSISSPVGWSSNVNNNTIVLSDPHTNFQKSTTGYNYWTQIDASGNATINGIVPNPDAAGAALNAARPTTYRMSIYQYGQWGETRIDGVQVQANKLSIPNVPGGLKFIPENFSNAAPIFTVGTPDRSSHEFLNGHNPDGTDKRDYWGSYNYWQEEADLGNPGKVVYYGTAVGATPATNDPNKWIANQWNIFNPALYDYANNSNINTGASGYYASNKVPAYVGNPATYKGLPWEVHFTTTDAQKAQGNFVVLSVGIAGTKGSLTVDLNGGNDSTHSRVWHVHDTSDPMDRSGDAGFYQWVAFEWPASLLNGSGLDDVLTFSASQNDGLMYDALRLEIGGTANPNVTGWFDYDYINSNASTNAALANDSIGLTASNSFVPEPSSLVFLAGLATCLLRRRRI